MTPLTVYERLAATGPFTEQAEKLMLYGQFVGSWDVDVTWYEPGGAPRKGKGEWHFGWILGGRGIQDVLHAAGAPPHKFGTTLRCYDSGLDAWHVTWMQPYGGEYVHLIGRQVDDRIVQEEIAPGDERRERWSFIDITPDSFTWLGEVSLNGGCAWFLEQEMRATRRAFGT